ncbi:serine/threonine-protein kinase S6KL [Tribolium castaneum]|uniref:serine/threonine-protein kinase S6KL n=1 Tax=Tribolium castaneum TaxID=7070 RepID=UPI0030FF0B80
MGNTSPRPPALNQDSVDGVYTQRREDSCQNLSTSSSGRSFASVNSHQSTFSVSRPWSRVSRRRWKESTLTLPYESSKTAWPVSQIESFFLPEFPFRSEGKHFTNLGEINKGAFGKVYKVSDEKGTLYALKVLSKSKIIRENAVQQVKDEVRIQRVCGHHPFIVDCPFHWQSKKRLFIVSNYVAGGELYDLLKTYTVLPVALVKLYVAQLALALDFLHNAGVIYRDLKPENILLDASLNVQLIDFGLSKWLPYGKTTRTICGTFLYMAPEVWTGEEYGHGVDWWSLGVIACVMLTGKYPSAEPDSGQFSTVLPQVGLDGPARDLLQRLLQVKSAQRLRTLRALKNIAFYKGYSFDDVKDRQVNPKELLPEIPEKLGDDFEGFDESFVTQL